MKSFREELKEKLKKYDEKQEKKAMKLANTAISLVKEWCECAAKSGKKETRVFSNVDILFFLRIKKILFKTLLA